MNHPLLIPLRNYLIESLDFVGGMSVLFRQVLRETFKGKFYFKLLVEQIFQVGYISFPLIIITAIIWKVSM